jgi:MYXO-CTERM domain-containing protein
VFSSGPCRGGLLVVALALLGAPAAAKAATLYVAKSGSDASNACKTQATPCATISHGIASMAASDTLIIGDGTYTDPILNMPSGSASAYTTIRAANDWGVLIDGSAWADNYAYGVSVSSKHYVLVRGIRVKMNQNALTNDPITVTYSDHVKIQRCSASNGPISGNASTIAVGPMDSYVLVEESYAFGGSRYQFLVYQSDHVVVRRSVARNDYWNGTLQCAGFANYDSTTTNWQNNIAIDSDTANCSGHLYSGFYNENQPETVDDTSETFQGNIILNVKAFYAGILDWVASGNHNMQDTVIWGSSGGYYGDQGPGLAANITGTRMTVGGTVGGTYNHDGGWGLGTGVSIVHSLQNSFTNSLFSRCASFGVADYTTSDYNAFSGNGANYGGTHASVAGAHDQPSAAVTTSLRYLPRIEPGSPLKTAGSGGGQVGAEVMYMIGGTGTLSGEAGFDQLTTQQLWPFPNEDQIRTDMASYNGPGAVGPRGFATGNSLDGTPQTLTKYIWEYLGNQIPPDIYGLHIAVGSLPAGVVGTAYSTPMIAGGGTPPYAWTMTGTLPAGLALNTSTGMITGTPTAVGSSNFTIMATDSRAPSQMATKALSIVVTATATGTGGAGAGGSGAGGATGGTTGGTGGGTAGGTGGGTAGGTGGGTAGTPGGTGGGTIGGTGGRASGSGGLGASGVGGGPGGPQEAAEIVQGCGCQVVGDPRGSFAGLLVAMGALLLARRRAR